MASLLRYFQAHPSLAYLFTGVYVGASSQAPRPDESSRDLYDLDLGYEHLAALPPGEDHRYIIGETLRHLHTDITGNTHRSEISFDKFWNVGGPPGSTSGLIEFRAIESLPSAEWMSLVALLWQAIAAFTLDRPSPRALVAHGSRLHDRFFLPTPLWEDLRAVLADLRAGGFDFPEEGLPRDLALAFSDCCWRRICRMARRWRCAAPARAGPCSARRRARVGRPAASWTRPSSDWSSPGRRSSRRAHRVFVNGRELRLSAAGRGRRPAGPRICGLRYRRTALYPSLHPGIKPHLPLELTVTTADAARIVACYRLEEDQPAVPRRRCLGSHPSAR